MSESANTLACQMRFLGSMSIDGSLYWRARGVGGEVPGNGALDVFFRRDGGPQRWSLRRGGVDVAASGDAAGFVAALVAAAVDVDDLLRQVAASVMTQAVFADMVLSEARALLGPGVVEAAVAEARVFLGGLSAAVAAAVGGDDGGSRKPLRLVGRIGHV